MWLVCFHGLADHLIQYPTIRKPSTEPSHQYGPLRWWECVIDLIHEWSAKVQSRTVARCHLRRWGCFAIVNIKIQVARQFSVPLLLSDLRGQHCCHVSRPAHNIFDETGINKLSANTKYMADLFLTNCRCRSLCFLRYSGRQPFSIHAEMRQNIFLVTETPRKGTTLGWRRRRQTSASWENACQVISSYSWSLASFIPCGFLSSHFVHWFWGP